MAYKDIIDKGFDSRTTEEQQEISKKAGIKSGEARRRKKQLKEELEILMETLSNDGRTYQELISAALLKEALKGNTKAYEIIRDTMGEKPLERQEIKQDLTIKMDEKADKLAD